jgi:hypothetical protein
MAKRIRVGVPLVYRENWVAGAYYVNNLIHALNLLEDEQKPELLILLKSAEDFEIVRKTEYPYVKRFPLIITYNRIEQILNKLSRKIFGSDMIKKGYTDKDMNAIFPYTGYYVIPEVKNKLYWIPDFQDRYYPDFFSKEEIEKRKKNQDVIAASGCSIIFSSQNARNDFHRFYPDSKSRSYVLHFAATHPEYSQLDIDVLKRKYKIHKT